MTLNRWGGIPLPWCDVCGERLAVCTIWLVDEDDEEHPDGVCCLVCADCPSPE